MEEELKVGDEVPPFLVKDYRGYDMTDESLIGNPSVLMFLPNIWSDNSMHILKVLQHNIDKFQKLKAKTYGVGPESYYELGKSLRDNKFTFTLLSDVTKHTFNRFGLLNEDKITPATYVVNSVGIITWIEKPINPEKHIGRIFHELKVITQV